MAARLPRQGLPALPAAPDQNGGPTPHAGCRGHVMTAPPPAPREGGGGGSSASRPAGPPPPAGGGAWRPSAVWSGGAVAAAAELGARAGMLARVRAGASRPAALGAGRAQSGSRRIVRRLFASLEARVPPALGFKTKLIFPEK